MADVMRWRYQNTQPVVAPAQSAILYEIGDLLYQSINGLVYPASSQPDQGTENDNQILFACRFLGVAMQRSRVGDTDDIRVATAGVFEFCVAVLTAELPLGTRFGASEDAAATGLLDQTVEEVTDDVRSIARLYRVAQAGDTCVWIKIRSEIMDGGIDPGTCESSSCA